MNSKDVSADPQLYIHDKMNIAYKAGVRHSLELIDWAIKENVDIRTARMKIEELNKTLYV